MAEHYSKIPQSEHVAIAKVPTNPSSVLDDIDVLTQKPFFRQFLGQFEVGKYVVVKLCYV